MEEQQIKVKAGDIENLIKTARNFKITIKGLPEDPEKTGIYESVFNIEIFGMTGSVQAFLSKAVNVKNFFKGDVCYPSCI